MIQNPPKSKVVFLKLQTYPNALQLLIQYKESQEQKTNFAILTLADAAYTFMLFPSHHQSSPNI